MGVRHSKLKNKSKKLHTDNNGVDHVQANGNGTVLETNLDAPETFQRDKKRHSFFRFRKRRRNSLREVKTKTKPEEEHDETKEVDEGRAEATERLELDNANDILNEKATLKGTKEKSRSVSNFERASSMRASSMKAINSIMNLHRSNSLRSLLGRERRNRRRNQLDGDLDADDDKECHFDKLYQQDLHLKVFQYFSLAERVKLRAVCSRWDKDLFREQRYMCFPLFKADSVPANNRQAKLLSKKYLYYCFRIETLKINYSLTRALFLDLLKCLHRSHLSELVFNVAAKEKNEIIQCNLYGNFCRDFAQQITTLRFVLDRVQESLKHADFSLNDTTDFILLMTIVHDHLFTSLVNFELILSTKLTANYFRKFVRFYAKQLEKLSIKFCFKVEEFVQQSRTILEDLKLLKHLKSLSISFIPFVITEGSDQCFLNLEPLLHTISLLANHLPLLECFELCINNEHVRLTRLNVLQYISSYRQASRLGLTIFGTIYQLDSIDLSFDFEALSTLDKLKHFEINCSKLTDVDIEQLAWWCPRLHSLTIGCEVHITNVSMDKIARMMNSLTSVSITSHRCLSPYVQPVCPQEHLFIDNDALSLLLDSASLQSIRLENGRIDIENVKLLEKLATWADGNKGASHCLHLAHNRLPLKLTHVFVSSPTTSSYMRQNLNFHFE